MELNFNSVETIPVLNASATFKTDSGKVFKEDVDIVPTIIDKSLSYIPWGSDNNMPYHILELIESDETLSTCQMFNAEVCYGSGLQYNTDSCGGDVKREVEDFLLDNALPSYFLGGRSRTSCSTTPCPLTSSVCARTSSTSPSASRSSSSMLRAPGLYG